MLRLSPAGVRLLDAWTSGQPADDTAAALRLRRSLVEAGLLHPVVDRHRCQTPLRVGFVVPVFEDAGGVRRAVASIRAYDRDAPIVVVDDASSTPVACDGATVVRHSSNRGPAAARNTGVAALPAAVEVVIFVDSDVELMAGCVATLLAHLEDSTVTAVAPRIQAEAGERLIDRYEATASPLDLGPHAAVVRPGSPVPYVPSTVLAVRRSEFEEVDGFDESMRVGEDVDLIWRLLDAGGFVRYEPAAHARHRNRPSWAALARQRYGYATAAADLDERHPGDVAPVEIPMPMLLAWSSAWLAGPVGMAAGLAIAASEARKLHARLGEATPDRLAQTVSLSLLGHRHAAVWLGHAVRRAWLPFGLAALPFSARARRTVVAAWVLPLVSDWVAQRPRMNPASYLAARTIDDTAYCAGLWRGVTTAGSWRALLPRTRSRTVADAATK